MRTDCGSHLFLVAHALAFVPDGEQESVGVGAVGVDPLAALVVDGVPPCGTCGVVYVGGFVAGFTRGFRCDALFLCDGER